MAAQIAELEVIANRYLWLTDKTRGAVELDSVFDEYGIPIDSAIDAAIAAKVK